MITTDGYKVDDEHLSIILEKLNDNYKDLKFNITTITKDNKGGNYYLEGTYIGVDILCSTKVTFDYIKQEIRNKRINKILE